MNIKQIFEFKILNDIFFRQDKLAIFIIVTFSLLTMILEILSIGILIPLISLLVLGVESLNLIKFEDYFFKDILLFFLTNINYFILLIFLIFLIKNTFVLYSSYYQIKYFEKQNKNLSNKLFKNYLYKEYPFFINQNIASTLRNLRTEVGSAVLHLRSFIGLVSEIFIILGLLILLLYSSLTITLLIIIVFLPLIFVFHILTKKKIYNLGLFRIDLESAVNKNIIQGIKSIKEIKLMNKEKVFNKEFNNNIDKLKANNIIINFIASTPRLALEVLIVGSILCSIIFLKYFDFNKVETISILTVFTLSSIRMMPTISRIIQYLQTMKFRQASLKLIDKELKVFSNNEKHDIDKLDQISIPIEKIEIKNLYFGYSETKVINDLNYELKKNDILGIVGKTGSGKSTFVDLLTGLLDANSGKILVDGIDISKIRKSWQKEIAYVSQKIYLIDESIEKNIAFELDENLIDKNKIREAIKLAELENFIDSLKNKEKTIVGDNAIKLSGGQIQRIALARAFYINKSILIFDESTSALDETTEKKIIENIIKIKDKKIIIFVSHKDSIINYCNKKLFINH